MRHPDKRKTLTVTDQIRFYDGAAYAFKCPQLNLPMPRPDSGRISRQAGASFNGVACGKTITLC